MTIYPRQKRGQVAITNFDLKKNMADVIRIQEKQEENETKL